MDFVQVLGRLAEIVQADDSLRLPKARNFARNVLLQIDVIDAFHNGQTEKNLPLGLGSLPPSTVRFPAALGAQDLRRVVRGVEADA